MTAQAVGPDRPEFTATLRANGEKLQATATVQYRVDVDLARILERYPDDFERFDQGLYADWEVPIAFLSELFAEDTSLLEGQRPYTRPHAFSGEVEVDIAWTETDFAKFAAENRSLIKGNQFDSADEDALSDAAPGPDDVMLPIFEAAS